MYVLIHLNYIPCIELKVEVYATMAKSKPILLATWEFF